MRRVVVTGCGIVSPVGIGVDSFWKAIISGKNGVERITQFNPDKFDSQIAGEVKNFDPSSILSPKEIKRTVRFVQFALSSAKEAVFESNLDFNKENPLGRA